MQARERLLDATKELLWERGYEATSPGAVQRRSGVGQGSYYHHFSGKEDLAGHALVEVSRQMRAGVDLQFAGASGHPLELVEWYLTKPRDALRGCRLGRLAMESAIASDSVRGPVAAYFAHLEDAVADALERAQELEAVDAAVDVRAVAAALVAMVQGGYVLARVHQDPQRMEDATRGAAALLDALRRPLSA